jgi:hypothetical protein
LFQDFVQAGELGSLSLFDRGLGVRVHASANGSWAIAPRPPKIERLPRCVEKGLGACPVLACWQVHTRSWPVSQLQGTRKLSSPPKEEPQPGQRQSRHTTFHRGPEVDEVACISYSNISPLLFAYPASFPSAQEGEDTSWRSLFLRPTRLEHDTLYGESEAVGRELVGQRNAFVVCSRDGRRAG